MKLLTKFNLILLVVFGIGGLIISLVISSFLLSNARREVLQEAELMMASAKSVRDYTSSDLKPLLEQNPLHKTRFLAVPVRCDPACLGCQKRPAEAPAAMLATYGSTNGFGWKPDSIVAAQIVS